MTSQKSVSARKRTKPRPSLSPSPAPPMDLVSLPHSAGRKTHRGTRANGHRTPEAGDEEVGMSLLGESERQAAAAGLDSDHDHHDEEKRLKAPMSSKDKAAMALLITLCA
jgi:hypothetical protein